MVNLSKILITPVVLGMSKELIIAFYVTIIKELYNSEMVNT